MIEALIYTLGILSLTGIVVAFVSALLVSLVLFVYRIVTREW